MAFWVGGLSARVRQLEKDALTHDNLVDRLARLETNASNIFLRLDSMDRGLSGLSRQIANLMKPGAFKEFTAD